MNDVKIGASHFPTDMPQSDRDSWQTPDWLFGYFDKMVDGFTLDAAATSDNACCSSFLTKEMNGMDCTKWKGHNKVWINPPFSNIKGWFEEAFKFSHEHEDRVVAIVAPDDISTAWFQYAVTHAAEMYGLVSDGNNSGRVGFIHPINGKVVKGNNKGTFVFLFRKRKRQVVTRWISRKEMELGFI